MSIADFTAAIKSQAFRDFFHRLSTNNILKVGVSDLRDQEQTAEKTSFYITTSTVADIISKLSGTTATPEQINAVVTRLKNVTYGRSKKARLLKSPYVEGEALYYPRVSFDTINRIVEQGFQDVLVQVRKINPTASVSDYYDKGHVYGIFPQKVLEAKTSISRNSTLDPKHRDLLVGIFEDLYKELQNQDEATSNLKTDSYTLYGKYKKSNSRYLVELQLKAGNQASGRAQAPLSTALRKFFNPGALPVAKGGLKFTSGIGEQLIQKLITSRGSPSFIDMIALSVSSILKGKGDYKNTYSIPETKVVESNRAQISTKKINAQIKQEKQATKNTIAKLKSLSVFTKAESSQTNLLAILQAAINQKVADNMGDGDQRRILNYRTGRFAESVEVQRISESRQGMITAFYSYMKNPYATFSEGGRQQYPKTRDPKLLISKSIREIAAPIVGNRLRSVVV